MERRRPRGRDTSGMGPTYSGGTARRGEGLGTGPVGSAGGSTSSSSGSRYSGTGSTGSQNKGVLGDLVGQYAGGSTGSTGSSGGGISRGTIVMIVALCSVAAALGSSCAGIHMSNQSENLLSSALGGDQMLFGGNSTTSSGWTDNASNVYALNNTVAEGSRDKFTQIIGNGEDQVTVMVYMCGSDLETNGAMATKDLQEMAAAQIGDNVNVIVFTGGAAKWNNNVISNKVNQIYRVTQGGLERLVDDAGTGALSSPETLSSFIKWAKEKYPANRNELILWDHGGGSLSGFGYDEKNAGRGYMSLSQINSALANANMKFDFIGFDACLMGTLENGLMLEKYADYLIASEETEPGVGWSYTNWLTRLSEDTSVPTTNLGKIIIDDYTSECAAKAPGQKTTLSLVDLAELAHTVPGEISAFSKDLCDQIANAKYKNISSARNNTREFAKSTYIDQVDLVNLAQNIGTEEGKGLIEAVKGAVKYNRTSANMTDAYGVSVYFPYARVSKVENAIETYNEIGMDADYIKCIKEFAGVEAAGQTSPIGSANAFAAIYDIFSGGSTYNSSYDSSSSSITSSVLSGLFGSRGREAADTYVKENTFDASKLKWETDKNGNNLIRLSDDQWELVNSIDQNMFLDDGQGYINLGHDNVYEYDENLDMIADTSKKWIGVNGQTVAYYHENTIDTGAGDIVTGYIPALLNGKRVRINVTFDSANRGGYISGVENVYNNNRVPQGKVESEIREGDKIDFLCDYFSYERKFNDSYKLGEQLVVGEQGLSITSQDMSEEKIVVTYLFTDIYNNCYWTPMLKI